MRAFFGGLLGWTMLAWLVSSCDTSEGSRSENLPCGECGEGCSMSVWDDDQRVARDYRCSLSSNGSQYDCMCDGVEASVRARGLDCTRAITRACGPSADYPGYCEGDAGLCWPQANVSDSPWLCRCAGSEAVVESDENLCEHALFSSCPVTCESELGRCASGMESSTYDCTCAAGRVTIDERDCDSALAAACEPVCSGELGQCYGLDDAYGCLCGDAQQLVEISLDQPCGEAMVVACAGVTPDDCSRETENVHAECKLEGSGYSCLCSTTFPGGAGVGGISDLGTWLETDDGWTLDITCEEALQQACFE